MPTPRNRLACANVGDFIYAIGGMDVRGSSDACERYDTKNDAWVKLAPMPTPRHGHALVALSERIVALGGEAGRAVGPVEVFDTKSGTWETWSSMPSNRLFFGAIAIDDAIYVFGGRTAGAAPSWKLDLKQRSWSVSEWPPPMERGRFAIGVMASADGSRDLVIVGGEDADERAVKDSVLRLRLPSK
jgi:N-acetylneuraminic acid mutarotase